MVLLLAAPRFCAASAARKRSDMATPRIQDAAAANGTRSEELRYNSVVAVNQGAYNVVLDDSSGKQIAKGGLVALMAPSMRP